MDMWYDQDMYMYMYIQDWIWNICSKTHTVCEACIDQCNVHSRCGNVTACHDILCIASLDESKVMQGCVMVCICVRGYIYRHTYWGDWKCWTWLEEMVWDMSLSMRVMCAFTCDTSQRWLAIWIERLVWDICGTWESWILPRAMNPD